MRIRSTIAVLFVLAVTLPLFAIQNRNQLKGFTPDGVYQFLGLDNINLFSGNLVLTIPIGQPYPVSSDFSYSFQLVCNGNVWDSEANYKDGLPDDPNPENKCRRKKVTDDLECTPVSAIPDRRSNAGLGCLVSFGRLFPPHHVTTDDAGVWVYESSDGAEHLFDTFNESEGVSYTKDGSYLRMRQVSADQRAVDLPDGTVRIFEPAGAPLADEWRLVRITNQHSANFVAIHYSDLLWTITDSHDREHRVTFEREWVDGSEVAMVKDIELAAANTIGAIASQIGDDGRVKYSFIDSLDDDVPANDQVVVPYWDTDNDKLASNNVITVPLLKRIVLPDGSAFALDHNVTWSAGGSGLPSSMRLPTGGCIAWEWDWFGKPAAPDFKFENAHLTGSHGVVRRVLSGTECAPASSSGSTAGTWNYIPELKWEAPDPPPCSFPPPDHKPLPCKMPRQMTTKVIDPLGHATVSYFSVAPYDDDEEWRAVEYGAPFTRFRQDESGSERFLSQQVFECVKNSSGQCITDYPLCHPDLGNVDDCLARRRRTGALLREQFVKYESDQGPPVFFPLIPEDRANNRLASSRTLFVDDGARFVDTTNSFFDGLGNYRRTVVADFSAVIDADRAQTTTTTFNMADDGDLSDRAEIPADEPWVLGTYASIENEESVLPSGMNLPGWYKPLRKQKKLFQFHETTRALMGVTTLGGGAAADDTRTTYDRDVDGNVILEKVYGGDAATLTTSTRPQYMVRHKYESGVLTSSSFLDPENCFDTGKCDPYLDPTVFTVDASTGLITRSRDAAGIETSYGYDAMSRLVRVKPDGGAEVTYSYFPATDDSNAVVEETVAGEETQRTTRFEYDPLGRLIRSSKSMPDGSFAISENRYDGLGRKSAVSQPVSAESPTDALVGAYWTRYQFDALGRPTRIDAPDDAPTLFRYVGDRIVERTSIATSADGGESAAVTRETYDAWKRLVQVSESSGNTSVNSPQGTTVATDYDYDVGGRLVEVTTGEQTRLFQYDGRGFLLREKHPESGETAYEDYDARGHARTQTNPGSILNFEYDPAERLRRVTSNGNLIKSFDFGTSKPSLKNNGKLIKAVRRNELQSHVIDVTESYDYDTLSGQMSERKTLVEAVAGSTRRTIQEFRYGVEYGDMRLPATVTMPECLWVNCDTRKALRKVSYQREAGMLTEVENFAELTYHPSGMVETVTHETPRRPVDEYQAKYGLARPSRIVFGDCTNKTPYFLPGEVTVKAVSSPSCGIHLDWPAATLCGGADDVQYRVLRDGVQIGECQRTTSFHDADPVRSSHHVYTVIAEGPLTEGGTGVCRSGRTITIDSARFLWNDCPSDTHLAVADVVASVGIPTTIVASLNSTNGPVSGELLSFHLFGTTLQARTGVDGRAAVSRVFDLSPGFYQEAIRVAYGGGLLPPSTATAHLSTLCDGASYSLDPAGAAFGADGGDVSVLVRTSDQCRWRPIPDPGFLEGQVTPVEARAGTKAFSVAVPSSTVARSATILVSDEAGGGGSRFRLEQASAPCTYRFHPEVSTISAELGPEELVPVDVIAPARCKWDVNETASWITFTKADGSPWDGSGEGTETIYVKVERNDGDSVIARTAKLQLVGKDDGLRASASVNQAGPAPCVGPMIIADLKSGTFRNGQDVVVGGIFSGTSLTYTWYRNGVPAWTGHGDAFADFVLPTWEDHYPAPGGQIEYEVEVANNCGRVFSSKATWRNISQPGECSVPEIRGHPESLGSPAPGSRLELAVSAHSADGSNAPLEYQWYYGASGDTSARVAGGTGSTVSVSPHETTHYWVRVTDACGFQDSTMARVVVARQKRRRAVRADFSGDGNADIVWQNTSTGQNEIWSMVGTTRNGTQSLPARPEVDARIQSIGDLNEDARPDLIWRNPQSGTTTAWLMNGRNVLEQVPLDAPSGEAWTVGAVADFDDDEHQDVVWHNAATGENEIWFHSTTEHRGTWALPDSPGLGVYGAGDFNGDEKPDLLLHDRATGRNEMWLMNDASRGTVASNGDAAVVRRRVQMSAVATESMTDPRWIPAQVTDIDGDDDADIIWRNTVTGENSVWLMDGTTRSQTVALDTRPELEWEIGGGGSATTEPPPGGGSRAESLLTLLADPAPFGSAAVVRATLTSASGPLRGRTVIFRLNATVHARLTTDEDGMATAALPVASIGVGSHPGAITVRFDGDDAYAATEASADLVVTASTVAITWTNPAAIVYGTALSAIQLNAQSTVPGSFTYEPASGTILPAGQHLLTVTFAPTDPNLAITKKSVALLVERAPVTISWPAPEAMTYGTPLSAVQLNAVASTSGEFVYEPAAGSVLPVGTSQLLTVRFASADPNHRDATSTNSVEVTKGVQRIEWPDPETISVLEPLSDHQLNAVVTTSGPAPHGSVAYDPAPGTLLSPGIHELFVSVAETDQYAAASAMVDIRVTEASSQVQWSAPQAVPYGTRLTSTQLNATATVPGTFTYTPAEGSLLPAGNHRLSVVFTPNDPRYQTSDAFVILTVTKATVSLDWPTPDPIVYGTPVNGALNAVADAPGEIVYVPAPGTILDAGTHRLHATFTPFDTVNVETVESEVTLVVSKAPQTIDWSAPAAIVYGTPLSLLQLNASVHVVGPAPAGGVTYQPAEGTVLDAGSKELTVTVASTKNYESASASVSIDVLRATLTLRVEDHSKLYGADIPQLTGTLTGAFAEDSLAAVYTTQATARSPVGTYAIEGAVVDPGGRLFNYDLTIVPGTLHVERAPLQIAAVPAVKQYSDPIPTLNAVFDGFVLGEGPSTLPGSLLVSTDAQPLSPPGTYSISAAGLTSLNYAITYVPAPLTVLPEDARLKIHIPTAITTTVDRSTAITLSATIIDISAFPEAGGDTFPGEIRYASVTFIDRTTDTPYCVGTVGLFDPADARVGVASCTFSRTWTQLPSVLPVAAVVGGFYVRDDVEDDMSIQVAAPTADFVTGGGKWQMGRTAGSLAPDAGSQAAFEINLQHEKSGDVKGKAVFRFVRTAAGVPRTYEVRADRVTSMSIARLSSGGGAVVTGEATIRDVTMDGAPALVAAAVPFTLAATDQGEPSSNDSLMLTLVNEAGGLWLACAWDGFAPAAGRVTSGNVTVHLKR